MTFNDIANRIVSDLLKEHDKEFGNNISTAYVANSMYHSYSNEERDLTMRREGYEKATEVVRQTLYKIVSEEIKSKNLDFLILNREKDYVSDRCIIDPLAYTIMGVKDGKLPREVFNYQWDIVQTMVKNGYLKKVYYFPIEFANVHDGVRSDDENYRKATDVAIKDILDNLVAKYPDKFEYETVHGTPLERVSQILKKEVK